MFVARGKSIQCPKCCPPILPSKSAQVSTFCYKQGTKRMCKQFKKRLQKHSSVKEHRETTQVVLSPEVGEIELWSSSLGPILSSPQLWVSPLCHVPCLTPPSAPVLPLWPCWRHRHHLPCLRAQHLEKYQPPGTVVAASHRVGSTCRKKDERGRHCMGSEVQGRELRWHEVIQGEEWDGQGRDILRRKMEGRGSTRQHRQRSSSNRCSIRLGRHILLNGQAGSEYALRAI